MTQQPHSDLQGELDDLRQRLGDLEAKHRGVLRDPSRSRLPEFTRKSLLGALSVVCLLAAGGLLYGQVGGDALFIDPNGNVGIGTNAPKQKLEVSGAIKGVGMTPPGGIVMFFGSISANFDANGAGLVGTPYEGWQLCNGRNNCPDLRDRFVVAAAGNYKVGDQGGTSSVALTLEQMPPHNHGGRTGGQNLGLNYPGVFWNSQGVSTGILVSVQQPSPRNRPNLLTTRGQPPIQILPGNHSHAINSEGAGRPHENRPPFFALAFIMRLP
jgi:microcystin-dependent protein